MPLLEGSVSYTPYHDHNSATFKVDGLSCDFLAASHGGGGVRLEWSSSNVATLKISQGTVTAELARQGSIPHEFARCELPEMRWPPPGQCAMVLSGVQSYVYLDTYTVHVKLVTPDDGLFSWERYTTTEVAKVAATHSSTLVHQQSPNDVCLDFVQLGQQLWTTKAFLVALSPYFNDLLSSEFAEGNASVSELSSAPDENASYPFDDSDAETDAAEVVEDSKKAASKPLAPFKRIPISEATYTTYFSVLLWMQTRHISFAPLESSLRPADNTSDGCWKERRTKVKDIVDSQGPLLPFPASPKSVYRLADLLSLDELKSLALANLISQITPLNAAYELYSDVATCYTAVRDAILTFVVEHWKEVKDAPATKEMERRGEAGELSPATTGTSMLLARKLMEKMGV
ncbi:hypothetical protein DMC30DRAFT_238402 [Rhodotorula diobovata]|uniref:BTB domain-containing protein n=1 Tax=Rhodotorula diobovata TaxID=5288 RepID=A0A5C5G7T6_9BASI|nr:hypothetical protein DMC30DRAFT_238402 [Rhodotorula diobovata]